MQFGPSVHEDKTRLIEFGRFAAERRAAAGQRRPDIFNFLGIPPRSIKLYLGSADGACRLRIQKGRLTTISPIA